MSEEGMGYQVLEAPAPNCPSHLPPGAAIMLKNMCIDELGICLSKGLSMQDE
jgi:hypothetical protein